MALATATSGITVGRFLRKLGYRNRTTPKSLRDPHQPRGINERLDSKQQQPLSGRLQHSLSLEVDAIAHVYQLAQSETFRQVVQQLTHADAVFVLGIQSTRGIANAFFSHLEYLRPRVSYSEGLSGSWVESLNSGFANPYIVLTDTRAYSAIARQYCRVASEKGPAMALITDIWCPWARDYPIDLLGEDRYRPFLGFAGAGELSLQPAAVGRCGGAGRCAAGTSGNQPTTTTRVWSI